jgi:dTMP kinase
VRLEVQDFSPTISKGFVAVEGVNGAGKSTVLSYLEKTLVEQEFSVCRTFEPGHTMLGADLRRLLLRERGIPRCSTAELLLFGADRAQHVHEVIEPALKRGALVLSDRYLYSTVAFQGYGRGIDLNTIHQVNELAVSGCYPDLVLVLDLPAEVGLKRTRGRDNGGDEDSFEQETLSFHTRIRNGFLEMAKTRPEPFIVIDAQQSIEVVCETALNAVLKVAASSKKRMA